MEDLDLDGLWWLPGNESDPVSGRLQFNARDKITLDLNGSFNGFEEFDDFKNYDIIIGMTSNGKRITLTNCYQTGSSTGFPGYSKVSYEALYLFFGAHLENLEELSFENYHISFQNLANWTRTSGFIGRKHTNQDESFSKLTINYEFPDTSEIAQIENTKISLDYTLLKNGDYISNVNLEQKTYIKLENDLGITFESFRSSYLYNIQNFLCLAMGTPTFPVEIKARSIRLDEEFDGKVVKNEIKIYYSNPNIPIKTKKLAVHQMVLPYQYIKEDLNTILNNWFGKYELLNPVFDLYFGTMYNTSMYLQHRFSSLIQAVESYHRRVYGGSYLDEDKYDELTTQIVTVINEKLTGDLRNIFTQKLSHINEVSLRKRLKDIIEKNQDVISPFIELKKEFVNAVLDTRNYLTHFDQRLEKSAKKGKELFNLCEILKFLLEVCLMKEIGVSKEGIIENISSSQKYNYVKSL